MGRVIVSAGVGSSRLKSATALGGFFDFGEFAVERGEGNAEAFGGFFFVAAAESKRAVEVGDFLVAQKCFQGSNVAAMGRLGKSIAGAGAK